MKNYKQKGKTMSYANGGSARASGEAIVISGLGIVIAMAAIAANETGEVLTEDVVTLDKATGVSFVFGAKVYWDDSAKKLTSVATSNTLCGFSDGTYASGDTEMGVKLVLGMDNDPGVLNQAAVVSFSAGSNLSGVDGAGSNAAPLAGTETRLDALDTAVGAILTSLKNAGLMATS